MHIPTISLSFILLLAHEAVGRRLPPSCPLPTALSSFDATSATAALTSLTKTCFPNPTETITYTTTIFVSQDQTATTAVTVPWRITSFTATVTWTYTSFKTAIFPPRSTDILPPVTTAQTASPLNRRSVASASSALRKAVSLLPASDVSSFCTCMSLTPTSTDTWHVTSTTLATYTSTSTSTYKSSTTVYMATWVRVTAADPAPTPLDLARDYNCVPTGYGGGNACGACGRCWKTYYGGFCAENRYISTQPVSCNEDGTGCGNDSVCLVDETLLYCMPVLDGYAHITSVNDSSHCPVLPPKKRSLSQRIRAARFAKLQEEDW